MIAGPRLISVLSGTDVVSIGIEVFAVSDCPSTGPVSNVLEYAVVPACLEPVVVSMIPGLLETIVVSVWLGGFSPGPKFI